MQEKQQESRSFVIKSEGVSKVLELTCLPLPSSGTRPPASPAVCE